MAFSFDYQRSSWPLLDPDAGLVFPRGGMRGAWHTGAIHAFTISGYFPTRLSGTSIGAVSAAGLATLGQLPDQDKRLEMLTSWIQLWQRNPARAAMR